MIKDDNTLNNVTSTNSQNSETNVYDANIVPTTPKFVSELSFSDEIKQKIYAFVNHVKTKDFQCGCLVTACPTIFIEDVLSSVSTEIGTNLRSLDFNCIEKEGDIAQVLTNSYEGDVLAIRNIEKAKPSLQKIICDALISLQLIITIGKGATARSIPLPIPKIPFVIITDERKNVPVELFERVFYTIDFNQHKTELRKTIAKTTLQKYDLKVTEEFLDAISTMQVSDQQFLAYIFEIRNKAYSSGMHAVTTDLLNTTAALTEIEFVNNMSGREFEIFSGDLLRALGFSNIIVTQSSCDFGADIIAEKDDVRFAIQCKRYSTPVGVVAVQEVLASKSLHDCHVACILTNNTFTPAAEELAKKNLVILWGENKLKSFIERAKLQHHNILD